ncbi:predicted protein [Pyrenophora tritici-repentis Pt-1C-BFP]|uniref:Uncharacterized protein n=1 Tax=Pyrenophora tritici-repentis (strain Pt-1C-BFP) TaxID=426418 RepID=B2WN88_PYRTR|nr:uncharacterized protein PTRG_11537 [Pyrenophora tritici-repentis Pt-1C-BFP]EDU44587.1 predicted protein [Pyrenophora tritici-repentis Pt-1C-BFP]KAI1525123.1 hypothetical protein PtrSN001A_010539 [Pyrenophora tritici-repentis]KAI1561039.1 hypothetical protein PtrEW7m1_011357 [Pyrenophora tritici-repentis]
MDADAVLKRFENRPSRRDHDLERGHSSGSDTPKKITNSLDELVEDRAKAQASELLERKHRKKRNTLDLQQREEYHSAGVFWSSRKLHEAEARKAVQQSEAECERLQKTHDRELKAAANL